MKHSLKARLRKIYETIAGSLELPYAAFLWAVDEAEKVIEDFLLIIGT
jgi:hypothetical protein